MKTSTAQPGSCEIAERVRASIRAENYEEVLKLLPEYHSWFTQAFENAASDPVETQRLAVEARDLLGWARSLVMANRAHDQAQADRIENAMRYRALRGGNQSWRFEA